jgi:hypothetical protein
VFAFCLSLALLPVQAPDTFAVPGPCFDIPIHVRPDMKDRLREVRLHVSVNQGRSWAHAATATADQAFFRFRATTGGLHWFAVQTVDGEGRVSPEDVGQLTACLKVVVGDAPEAPVLPDLPPPQIQAAPWREPPPDDPLLTPPPPPVEPAVHPTGRANFEPGEEMRLLWSVVEQLRGRIEELEIWQHPTK